MRMRYMSTLLPFHVGNQSHVLALQSQKQSRLVWKCVYCVYNRGIWQVYSKPCPTTIHNITADSLSNNLGRCSIKPVNRGLYCVHHALSLQVASV